MDYKKLEIEKSPSKKIYLKKQQELCNSKFNKKRD